MTREEREKALEVWYDITFDDKRFDEARKISIEALKTELTEDTISRQAVLDLQYRIDDSATLSTRDVVNVEDIADLPSVTPQPKTGKWLITPMSHIAYCSECDHLFKDIPASVVRYFKYCPNCKVKMIESEDEE